MTVVDVTSNDAFLIVASDGLWCRLENHQAANAIIGCDTAQAATDRLIFEAKHLQTHDNTTVTVVRLTTGPLPAAASAAEP